MKTLIFPLISAVSASLFVPAGAQQSTESNTQLTVSSEAGYRQNKDVTTFSGASFNVEMVDGAYVYAGNCSFPYYLPPNQSGACPAGTTGFLLSGNLGSEGELGPYYMISALFPSVFVEPSRPELCFLSAAPKSALPRPLAGFEDHGYTVYYDLTASLIKQYAVASYKTERLYTKFQKKQFQSEIVPGSYYFSFPRLRNPDFPVYFSSRMNPMPESYARINNQDTGLYFEQFGRWNADGFMEIGTNKPITFSWRGIAPTLVYQGSDALYLSIRKLFNDKNPKSPTDMIDDVTGDNQSIFPSVQVPDPIIPRLLLPSPTQNSFTIAPIFAGGTRAVLQLQFERNLQTNAFTYDLSKRTFEIPISVVNRYSEYKSVVFKITGPKTEILEDPDGDGYNNLNEWILGSNASQPTSIPIAPVVTLGTDPYTKTKYFGFIVNEKLGTKPAVNYTIQRSRNGGKSWSTLTSDSDWIVSTNHIDAGQLPLREIDPAVTYIKVESVTGKQPAGTIDDIYRVKITLK